MALYSPSNATLGFVQKSVVKNASDYKQEILDNAINLVEYGSRTDDGYKKNIFIPGYQRYSDMDNVLCCIASSVYANAGDIICVNITGTEGQQQLNLVVVATCEATPKTYNNGKNADCVGVDSETGLTYAVSIVVDNQATNQPWLNNIRNAFFGGDFWQQVRIHSINNLSGVGTATTESYKQVESDLGFLLTPSDDERKYGPNIYDIQQNLIRMDTAEGVANNKDGTAISALKSYSEFMYCLLNSQVSTASYVLIGMPWLRPGMNVWLDPLYSDTIYYLAEVQHQGGPTSGATTMVSLIFGRPRGTFVSDSSAFGSMKEQNDNVFINSSDSSQRVLGSNGSGPWGEYLENAAAFNATKTATEEFYSNKISGTMNAKESSYLKSLYANGSNRAPAAPNIDNTKIFNGEYTAAEIQAKIDTIYASAPAVVTERLNKLKGVVSDAKKYIELHYDKERTVE